MNEYKNVVPSLVGPSSTVTPYQLSTNVFKLLTVSTYLASNQSMSLSSLPSGDQRAFSITPSPMSLISNSSKLNRTSSQSPTYHYYGLAFVVPMSIILAVAIVLALGGNIMVILTIFKHKTMRTRTNMFIVSLSVADILVAVLDMPFSIVTLIEGDWVLGAAFCEFNGVTMSLFMVASVQTLMFISIHKYISITRPFSRFMTPKRILVMISVTWIWSFTYAIGGSAGWTENVYKSGASQCGPTYPVTLVQLSHSVCNTVFNLLIPIAVTCFCYTKIFCEIRSHMSRMRENTNIDMKISMMQQKRISVTLLVVLICFLTCWSPYIVYSCYAAFTKDKESVPVIANPLAYWCGYINSACNPIIYAFRSPSFRQGYYSIVCGEQPRQFNSAGSFSQRSPSSFRKKGSLKHALHIGTNGESLSNAVKPAVAAKDHKHRTKRLVSMNSWASISFSAAPFRKASGKEGIQRQISVESEATVRPLLQSSSESPVTPNAPNIKSNGTFEANAPNETAMEIAETSLTVLSPILEGSVEDLAIGNCDKSDKLTIAKKMIDATEIACNVAFTDCQKNEQQETRQVASTIAECAIGIDDKDEKVEEINLLNTNEQMHCAQNPKKELKIEFKSN